MSVSFCLPHALAFSAFMIYSDFCAFGVFVDMLAVCVLYVSLGSSVTPKIFRCVFMGSVVWSICRCCLV